MTKAVHIEYNSTQVLNSYYTKKRDEYSTYVLHIHTYMGIKSLQTNNRMYCKTALCKQKFYTMCCGNRRMYRKSAICMRKKTIIEYNKPPPH